MLDTGCYGKQAGLNSRVLKQGLRRDHRDTKTRREIAGLVGVVIDGRCMVLTSLSDFVSNLENSGYFKKSVEIVNSQAEPSTAAGNLIKFSIKAQFQPKG